MRKLNLAIALGVVLALMGAASVFAYGRKVDDKIADGRKTQTVLVATRPLAGGMPAAEVAKSVAPRPVPGAYVADGALTSIEQVQSMTLLGPVGAGSQLSSANFGRAEDVGGLKPSPGNTALAVGVDLVPGVARYISAPGLVDLFVTYPANNDKGSPSASRTKLFASGVKVLSVSVAPVTEKKDDNGNDAASAPANQVIAVLDVPPPDAERIVNSATLGKLYLGLNGAGEPHVTPSGATPDDVVLANR